MRRRTALCYQFSLIPTVHAWVSLNGSRRPQRRPGLCGWNGASDYLNALTETFEEEDDDNTVTNAPNALATLRDSYGRQVDHDQPMQASDVPAHPHPDFDSGRSWSSASQTAFGQQQEEHTHQGALGHVPSPPSKQLMDQSIGYAELSNDDSLIHQAVEEQHGRYFFPSLYDNENDTSSAPLHDWTTQTEEIARRIEMASAYCDWTLSEAAHGEAATTTEPVRPETKLIDYSPPPPPPPVKPPPANTPPPQATEAFSSPPDESILDKQFDEFEERALRILSNEVGYKQWLGQSTLAWTDAPVGLAASRFVDTIEDAIIHWRRLPYKLGFKDLPDESVPRPTVVVLGTGWGAHAFVKVACTFDLRIIVVSPSNHFVFTPMLASASVGTVEYRSMTEAIRSSNPTIENYIEGKAVDVDPTNKELVVQLTSLENSLATQDTLQGENLTKPKFIQIKYDYLVCAVGTTSRSGIVPGAKEYCYNLKTTGDSKLLRTAIGEALEYASRPDVRGSDPASVAERHRRVTFCIIGGGPTGVELAGEVNDFLKQVCKPRQGAYARLKPDVSVMLVHGGAELLPAFEPELRQRALASLQAAGIEVRLNTRSTEVGQRFIRLKQKGENTVEEEIPVGLTVWAAGNTPAPFVGQLLSRLPSSAAGPGGRVHVDRWLRCPTPTPESFGSILVLGDAAYMAADENDPSTAYPQTAQVAGQQGAFAARLLNRGYQLNETPPRLAEDFDGFSKLRIWLLVRGLDESPPFTFLNLGILAYVGGGEAVAQVQLGDVPLFSYAGNVAFALWRSVYLVKQVATKNRFMVTFDWVKSELFGRDITRL